MTVIEPVDTRSPRRLPVIDTDVHQEPDRGAVDLLPYLDPDWADYVQIGGFRAPPPPPYAVWQGPNRRDQLRPGSRPDGRRERVAEQHLDPWEIDVAILTGGGQSLALTYLAQREFASKLAAAFNDWTLAEWLEGDPRLLGSIVVAPTDPIAAAAEIDRVGPDPRFVQVMLPTRSPDAGPWSDERYDPIWEAAVRNDVVVGFHLAPGAGAVPPPTTAGWPRSYYELTATYPIAAQVELIFLVARGTFSRFPGLRVGFIENGFAWLPSVMWRMDKRWRELREEVPWLQEKPSDIIRRHVRFSTQPMEEPGSARELEQLLEMLGSDELLMFSSDYPHWDFDSPRRFLPSTVSASLREKILYRNAFDFYRIDDALRALRPRRQHS